MSTFPVPPDVRDAREFRIIKGVDDNLIRTDRRVDDNVTDLIKQGEWVHLNDSGEVIKAEDETNEEPMQGAYVCWTRYKKGDASDGQADAAGNQQVTLISGPYKAATKLYDGRATYHAGDLLVVVDAGSDDVGVLSPVAPDSATTEQLAMAVGTVDVPPVDGILIFSSNGKA